MIDDRNKTEITKLVTAVAFRYLDERGFKPVETEVPVALGWVSDLAGVIVPTETELQELKLIRRKPRWKESNPEERAAWHSEAKQFEPMMTCIVEVKTSCSDFRGDKKWSIEPPVNLSYIAIPRDLAIRTDEMPIGWGVLEYTAQREYVSLIKSPSIRKVSTEQHLTVVHEIAIRRDHSTRHTRARELQRRITANINENISRTRMSTAIRAVMAIVNGCSMGGRMPHSSVEEALQYHSIKHVSGADKELLEKLWNTAEKARV